MPDAPPPEMLKKMRLASESTPLVTSLEPPSSSTAPSKRVATVQDADDDDDVVGPTAGENFAPGNDPDYFAEEDEDGRFFGGGLTNEQKEILNIFDNAGTEQVPDDVRIHTLSNIRHSSLVFIMSISLKCSPLRVLKSCCYG
jgi:beta-catenin-like protein 1